MAKSFEIRNQSIDAASLKEAKDFSEFQKSLERQKKQLLQQKSVADAEKFFEGMQVNADRADLKLQIGDTYLSAISEEEFDSFLNTIGGDLDSANGELETFYQSFESTKNQATKETQQKMSEMKADVQSKYVEVDSQGRMIFKSMADVQAYMQEQGDEDNNDETVTDHYTNREERKMKLNAKMREANTEERQNHLSKRLKRISRRKNALDQKTRNRMEDAGVNTLNAHEAKNQTWYYNDMIEGITKRDGRVRYDGKDLIIDTYNPLFSSPLNLPGSVRVACSAEDLQRHGVSTETVARYQHPDLFDNKGDMKGLFPSATEWMANKTNMSPKQKEFWNSALKLGSVVGLAVVAWNFIGGSLGLKKKFFGKEVKWRKILLGGAGGVMLSQTVVGQDPLSFVYKLFNGGLDSKTLEKLPSLKGFTDKMKLNPEFNDQMRFSSGMNLLFPGNSYGEAVNQYSVVKWSDEKPKVDRTKLEAYYEKKISNTTIESEKQSFVAALQAMKAMTEDQLNELFEKGSKAAGINTYEESIATADYNRRLEEHAKKQAESLKNMENPVIITMVEGSASDAVRKSFEGNNKKLLTKEQGNALENALDKVKQKDSGARIDFSPEHGIMLHTSNGDVPLKMSPEGKWQVAGFERAQFDNAEHALRVAAITSFIINHFSGRQTRDAAFTVSQRGDIMFNEITFNGRGTGLSGTEVVDGGDWNDVLPGQNSTILEAGGSVFESNVEAYRDYLNSLKNTNGNSIWKRAGQVTTTTQIAGFIPTWKSASPETPKSTETTTPVTPETQPAAVEPAPENKEDNNEGDNEETPEENKINPEGNNIIDPAKETTDASFIEEKANEFEAAFEGKDGDGNEMPHEFFTAWAETYGKDGNYRVDFLYENTLYRRQGGELAPTTDLTKAQQTRERGTMK